MGPIVRHLVMAEAYEVLKLLTPRDKEHGLAVVAHAFNANTWKAEAG